MCTLRNYWCIEAECCCSNRAAHFAAPAACFLRGPGTASPASPPATLRRRAPALAVNVAQPSAHLPAAARRAAPPPQPNRPPCAATSRQDNDCMKPIIPDGNGAGCISMLHRQCAGGALSWSCISELPACKLSIWHQNPINVYGAACKCINAFAALPCCRNSQRQS